MIDLGWPHDPTIQAFFSVRLQVGSDSYGKNYDTVAWHSTYQEWYLLTFQSGSQHLMHYRCTKTLQKLTYQYRIAAPWIYIYGWSMQVESISSSMNSNTILIINNIPWNVSLIDNYQLRRGQKAWQLSCISFKSSFRILWLNPGILLRLLLSATSTARQIFGKNLLLPVPFFLFNS
jgi:hypothetical protein